ncbi:MAG: hypothetical protein GX020_07740 [Firmicutes bacterium]|nr:hypothetical protein [Bacillota bacterium]
MRKNSKVHFLTSYVEYLMDNGIRSEEYYVGDASRFIRYLLANVTEKDVINFIEQSAQGVTYKLRLQKTLKRFFTFAAQNLAIKTLPQINKEMLLASNQEQKLDSS